MKTSTAWVTAALCAWLPAVAMAKEGGDVNAAYRQARTQARAAYTDALGICHQHPATDVLQCREQARDHYRAELDSARDRYLARKQMQPLVTPQDYYRNDRREAWAAYEEAKESCQQMSLAQRTPCMRQARGRFNLEMREARAELDRRRLDQAGSGERGVGAGAAGTTSSGDAGR